MAVRTFVPILIPGLLATAVSAGCSSNSSSAASGKPQGTPALTKAQAQQALTSFADGINRAGHGFSGKTLRSVEADPQLSMDYAALRLRRTIRKRPPKLAFTDTTFYIPRLTGYPHWFAADAVSGKGKGALRHALLFTQAKQGAPWLLAADPYPSENALSRVALDPQGLATPVGPDVKDLAVAPAKLPQAHASLLTDGPKASGASVLADGAKTSETYKALKQGEKVLAGRGVTLSSRFSPGRYKVYALRTKDRGAVVWYVLQQNEAYSASRRGKLAVSGDLIGLAPAKSARTRMDTTVLVQYLATVPPKGRATVSGMYRKAVAAHGT
ncbi:hypothetical protein E1293_38160 [Actinomadura darangshiensis]|uniref:DUF8094 domain-containing protein n=1 Tax=Actinomadura darangshiensis TaxID=705336 RepID=A0A4V2YRZ4_9ACTN|nr:hypothetical protein [Actinomadura darangshiensis]TDD67327.1 hypothetical protein E1293_38160 [Actinomadura darangshiensis]